MQVNTDTPVTPDYSQAINISAALDKARNYGLVLQNFIEGTRGFAEALNNDIVPSLEWLENMKSLFGVEPNSNKTRTPQEVNLHQASRELNPKATVAKPLNVDFNEFIPQIIKDKAIKLEEISVKDLLTEIYVALQEAGSRQTINITRFTTFLSNNTPGLLTSTLKGLEANKELFENALANSSDKVSNGISSKLFAALIKTYNEAQKADS